MYAFLQKSHLQFQTLILPNTTVGKIKDNTHEHVGQLHDEDAPVVVARSLRGRDRGGHRSLRGPGVQVRLAQEPRRHSSLGQVGYWKFVLPVIQIN